MSSKLRARQVASQSQSLTNRLEQRQSGASGVHADQDRRRGARSARGGRQGERNALRRNLDY